MHHAPCPSPKHSALTLPPLTRYGKFMSKEERSAIAWLESAVVDGLEWHRGKQLTYPKPTPDPTPNPSPSPYPNPHPKPNRNHSPTLTLTLTLTSTLTPLPSFKPLPYLSPHPNPDSDSIARQAAQARSAVRLG